MWKTILTATDGSDHARKAVTLAADLASKYDAGLVILHVLNTGPVPEELRHLAEVEHITDSGREQVPEVPVAAAPRPGQRDAAAEYRVHQFIGQRIVEEARKMARDAGVSRVETELAEGDPSSQVLEHARNHGADAIVLGSRGLGDLRGLLMGSVSHKVSSLAPVTCITVK